MPSVRVPVKGQPDLAAIWCCRMSGNLDLSLQDDMPAPLEGSLSHQAWANFVAKATDALSDSSEKLKRLRRTNFCFIGVIGLLALMTVPLAIAFAVWTTGPVIVGTILVGVLIQGWHACSVNSTLKKGLNELQEVCKQADLANPGVTFLPACDQGLYVEITYLSGSEKQAKIEVAEATVIGVV